MSEMPIEEIIKSLVAAGYGADEIGDVLKQKEDKAPLGKYAAGSREHIDYMRLLKQQAMEKHGITEGPTENPSALPDPNMSLKQFNAYMRSKRKGPSSPLNNTQDAIEQLRSIRADINKRWGVE